MDMNVGKPAETCFGASHHIKSYIRQGTDDLPQDVPFAKPVPDGDAAEFARVRA
jgi:hypothetical protein